MTCPLCTGLGYVLSGDVDDDLTGPAACKDIPCPMGCEEQEGAA